MRKSIVLLMLFVVLSTACNEDDTMLAGDGVYKGIFYRSTPQQRYYASTVTLELSGGKFGGISSETHYPAICTGSYENSGKAITFANECVFTADFDWTFVLDGEYKIALDNEADSLFLIQEVSEETFNIFHLARN